MSLSGKCSLNDWGNSKVFRIPSKVFGDSRFPFKLKDNLVMEIKDNYIVIKKQ